MVLREVHDKNITGNTTISSIMDYDPINIAPPGLEQGTFQQNLVNMIDGLLSLPTNQT